MNYFRIRAFFQKLTVPLTVLTSLLPANAADPGAKRAASSVNEFGVALRRQLPVEENLIYSPFSVSMALAMTLVGARGKTASEMEAALRVKASEAPADLPVLTKALGESASGETLSIANALWPQEGAAIRTEFLQVVKDSFHAEARPLDYRGQTERARQTINEWVTERTMGKIPDLIPRGALTANSRLVLTNAIYFKGQWAEPFLSKLTRQEPFHPLDGEPKPVAMMHQQGSFAYAETPALQALELPYAGGRLGLVILLPRRMDGIRQLEKDLSFEKLTEWASPTARQRVQVSMPKFKLESSFDLAESLGKIGIRQAFTDAADFSGINGAKDLFISSVVHKAMIEVNEEGTEAAAATGAIIGITSAGPAPPAVTFRADHPFLYVVRDRATSCMLFAGRVVDPK